MFFYITERQKPESNLIVFNAQFLIVSCGSKTVSDYFLINSKFKILNSKLPYLAPSPNNTVFTVRIITIISIRMDMFLM